MGYDRPIIELLYRATFDRKVSQLCCIKYKSELFPLSHENSEAIFLPFILHYHSRSQSHHFLLLITHDADFSFSPSSLEIRVSFFSQVKVSFSWLESCLFSVPPLQLYSSVLHAYKLLYEFQSNVKTFLFFSPLFSLLVAKFSAILQPNLSFQGQPIYQFIFSPLRTRILVFISLVFFFDCGRV